MRIRTEVIRETAAERIILSDAEYAFWEILVELTDAIHELNNLLRRK